MSIRQNIKFTLSLMKDYNIILTVVPASSIAFFLKTNEASWLTIFSNSSLIKGVIGLSA